jgi:hypothetical protein
MKRRTKRDLSILVAILAVIGGVIFVNGQLSRRGDAEAFENLRTSLEQKRLNSGTQILKWNIIRTTKGSLTAGGTFTDDVKALNGKEVYMIGFMVPDETYRDVTEFLMLPIPIECYFCQMPPSRDVLWINLREGEKTDIKIEPVLIRGTFTLHEGPNMKFFYSLENATFEAAENGGALTNRRLKLQHMVPNHQKDNTDLLPGYTDKDEQAAPPAEDKGKTD